MEPETTGAGRRWPRSAPSARSPPRRRCRGSRRDAMEKETPSTARGLPWALTTRSRTSSAGAPRGPRAAGTPVVLLGASATSRPTIARAMAAGVGVGGADAVHRAPRAHHRDVSRTSITSSSLWVMRTTVAPSLAQPAQHLPQLLHLGGRQHGGGLVEDQHLRAAVERLEDLHALRLAHREAETLSRSGSTASPVRFAQLGHVAARAVEHQVPASAPSRAPRSRPR
jgi:hypothetical protein